MLDCLVEQSGVSAEILELEFKAIHQKHSTSEYAFSIQELPSLLERYPGEDLPKKFDEAIHCYNKARKEALRLYPSGLGGMLCLLAREDLPISPKGLWLFEMRDPKA